MFSPFFYGFDFNGSNTKRVSRNLVGKSINIGDTE